ncbi:hypothetical protein L1987_82506 [Smallanthus sonchifolius]|uniref:Uncharacterized protein n=1 Tax=Smallanthus sonchifolius TaxID=185202 RepID=A0ACB8YAS0_9ASTR|nr:hypothetical protein L1987_82506 [Smallanthus sonchifolius]
MMSMLVSKAQSIGGGVNGADQKSVTQLNLTIKSTVGHPKSIIKMERKCGIDSGLFEQEGGRRFEGWWEAMVAYREYRVRYFTL